MFGSRRLSRPSADSVEIDLPNRSGRLVYKLQRQASVSAPSSSRLQPSTSSLNQQHSPNVPTKAHPRITAIAAESAGHGAIGRRASSPAAGAPYHHPVVATVVSGSPSGVSPSGRTPVASFVEIRQNRQNAQLLRKNLAYSASASANLGSYYEAPPTFLRRKSSVVSSLRLVSHVQFCSKWTTHRGRQRGLEA